VIKDPGLHLPIGKKSQLQLSVFKCNIVFNLLAVSKYGFMHPWHKRALHRESYPEEEGK